MWPAGQASAQECTGAACTTPVSLPFELPFSSNEGGIKGTGFTLAQGAVRDDRLTLDMSAGVLRIRTTPGIAYRTENSQHNALGVAMPADGRAVILETKLVQPPEGTHNYEQAGIWYGMSQDDYVKLVLISSRAGLQVQLLHEGSGLKPRSYSTPVLSALPAEIVLRLRVDTTADAKLTGAYELPGQPAKALKTMPLPAGLVASGISRGGVFATHRRANNELEYSFDRFKVRCAADSVPCPVAPAPTDDPDLGDGTDPVGVDDGDEVDQPPRGQSPTTNQPAGTGASNPVGDSVVTQPDARPGVSAFARRAIRPRALRRRGLKTRLQCTQTCDLRVDLLARRKGERPLALIGRRRAAAATERRVTIKPGRRSARRLRGARGLELRVQARFADGSTASIGRRVKLRR